MVGYVLEVIVFKDALTLVTNFRNSTNVVVLTIKTNSNNMFCPFYITLLFINHTNIDRIKQNCSIWFGEFKASSFISINFT